MLILNIIRFNFHSLILCLLIVILAQSVPLSAASFDCSKASSTTEIALCGNFALSVDDEIIAFLYKKHLDWRKGRDAWWSGTGVETPIEQIKADQKKWLKNERNKCRGDIGCLKSVLDLRIDYFLELVRLERPQSGSNHQVYFSSDNSKVALRLFAGIFENIRRHGMLPKFSNSMNYFFALNLPHSYEVIGHDLETLEPLNENIFSENLLKSEQINFGKFMAVDYEGLTNCLKSQSLSNVNWRGNWAYLNSVGENDCITFHWNDGFVQTDVILFPLVESKYVRIVPDNIINSLNICSGTSKNRFCLDNLVSELNQLRLKFASEFFENNPNSISKGLNANAEFLLQVQGCEDSTCIRELFLENISEFVRLIEYAGKIPPYCEFGSDGIYRCGEAQVCMSGISVFKLTKKSNHDYQLDFWAENWNYEPWNGENTPTKSLQGETYSSGTYPCRHDVYSFDGISMSYGGCTAGDIEPEGTMFWLSCEGEDNLCGQEDYVPCVAAR